MLLAVAVLALVAAAGVTVRWAVTRVDALGRVAPFPVISMAVSLLVAAGAGVPVLRHAQFERRLARVASELAGHPVTVRCETLSEAWTDAHPELGYVRFDASGRPEPLATITVQACRDLRAWVGSDHDRIREEQMIAVHVLTHEAMHLTGELDEARTECRAVQRDARTAELLGATPAQAASLARAYWESVYPRMPDAYRSAECVAGGRMDEGLASSPWSDVKGR
jgi:hypothetical protein